MASPLFHLSKHPVLRNTITIVKLLTQCPELNPVENGWRYMRDNWLSNEVHWATKLGSGHVSQVLV